ncbi:MAG: hypothetical protein ACYC10_15610 [Allorhizobium sp.]
MAFVSFLQRSALVLASGTTLAGCSADRLVPPAEIGSVSSDLVLEGPVGSKRAGRELLGRVDRTTAYARDPVRQNGAMQAIDYLDTPNLAGMDSSIPSDDPSLDGNAENGAQGFDGGEAALPAETGPSEASAEYVIPSEGINIDEGLGVASEGQTLAAPAPANAASGPITIPEDTTSQPVVDGIGTDNPVPLILPPKTAAAIDDASN